MRIFKTYLRANALQYAIFLSVMILLLLLSFLLFVNTNGILSLRTDNFINDISFQKSQIYLPKNTSLKTETQKWGAFDIVRVKNAESEERLKNQFQTIYLSAPIILSKHLYQLYVPSYNNKGSLQITGQASIQGNLSVPNSDIRTTSAAGFIYTGTTDFKGTIKNSTAALPEVKKRFYEDYLELGNDSIIPFDKSKIGYQSFKNRGVTVVSDRAILLNKHDYKGFVKIISSQQITVDQNSTLEDVELIAPVIKFQNGFTGKVHAVARDSIVVGEHVTLNFPSSLTITDSNFENYPSIVIQKNASVSGLVRQFKKVPETDSYPQLFISKDAIFKGSIYNVGNTELRGTVEGSLYTHSFIAYVDGRIYRNYIFDGKILKSEWFTAFEKSLTLPQEESNFPLKWLY